MTLATSLQALLVATSGLEELSSRHETADALFGFDRGQITENELAEVGGLNFLSTAFITS